MTTHSPADLFPAHFSNVPGQLDPEAYEMLFELVHDIEPRTIVEIGTAHGKATIAMAAACDKMRTPCRIYTVDSLSSATLMPDAFATRGADQESLVRNNFAQAGLSHLISLFVGSSAEFAASGHCNEPIDLLVLDADGRIDRDLLLFRNQIHENTWVVVDDTDGRPTTIRIHRDGQQTHLLDLKHAISQRLVNAFAAAGVLKVQKTVGKTTLCKVTNVDKWDHAAITGIALAAYREIIFTPIDGSWLTGELERSPDGRDIVSYGRFFKRYFGLPLRVARGMKSRVTGLLRTYG